MLFSKFNEFSLPVIFLPFKTKSPTMQNWSQFCDRLPSGPEIAAWDRTANIMGANYGLCLGPASRLIALDIDTEDESIVKLLPRSPLVKRGRKGETRFFKYEPHIQSFKLREHGVEVLSQGNQTVIPPSIHPEGMPYEWVGGLDLFSVDIDTLPALDLSFMNELPRTESVVFSSSGRNNKLVQMATAKLCEGVELNQVAIELMQFDADNHQPPLFSDREDVYGRTADKPSHNAMKMAASVMNSLAKKGLISPVVKQELTINLSNQVTEVIPLSEPVEAPDAWPRARGFMADVFEYCDATASGNQDALALGGGADPSGGTSL